MRAKTKSKLLLLGILFLLFLCNFEFLLGLLYFPREVFNLTYVDLLYGYYPGETFQWLWYYCFSHLYYTCLLRFFERRKQKITETFKHKNSIGRKCCKLKVLKAWLMHLFVTLLINKTTSSDNRHFSLTLWKNENKEEFLTCSTFCTFEQIKKDIYYGSDYPRIVYSKFI